MITDPRTGHDIDSAPIVAAAQAGDREAFGELYRLYANTVFRYLYYRVSTRALAEDLTGETFVRALRRISTYEDQGREFGAWLVTIGRNLLADHFKSARHRMEIPTGEMLDTDELAPPVDDEVLADITADALRAALADLTSAEQRECLTLRFLLGRSVAETADIMGKNEGAIKTLQYRAVRALGRDHRLTREAVA